MSTGDPTTVEAFLEPVRREGERAFVVVTEGGALRVVPLAEGREYVAGRGDVDLPLEDSAVSRRHFTIAARGEEVVVHDLGSRNGTYLNGRRIDGEAFLSPGDVILVGGAQIALHRGFGPGGKTILGRETFARRLHEEVARCLRYQRVMSIVMFEVDGPAAADLLCRGLREVDVVGWHAERRLAVLLPETSGAEALALGARLLGPGCSRAGAASVPDDALDAETLRAAAETALERAPTAQVLAAGGTQCTLPCGDGAITFADPAMLRLVAMVRRLSRSEVNILLHGETGVGKEIFAHAIHQLSPRGGGPLVAVNCAALPENLAESELFGHARGAFTGAEQARRGKLEEASGGTVFLDEVGDMPPPVQAKLLRVLEDRVVTRLGSNQATPVDIRVIAATNRNLEQDIEDGRFRQDLYFRLSGAALAIPPLRHRRREIPLLARRFADEAGARAGLAAVTLEPDAVEALQRHDWPGNARELRNAIEQAVALADPDGRITCAMLPAELSGAAPPAGAPDAPPERLADQIRRLERREIRRALRQAGGVKKRAAEILGMPLRTFHVRVKELDIDADAPDD